MSSSNTARRTLLLGLAAGVLALIAVALFTLWQLSAWGSGALSKVTDATMAAVSQSPDAARALDSARTTVADARGAVAEPEAALNRAADAATQAVARTVAAAAGAAGPVVSERVQSAMRPLASMARQDPKLWPDGLALRQLHYRQSGAVTEYWYAAAAGFKLPQLREQLVALGYAEHVIAEGEGTLEAVYRRDRQLLLSATTRDGRQYIDVRELPLALPARPDP